MMQLLIIRPLLIGLHAVPWKDALKIFRKPKREYSIEIFHYQSDNSGYEV
jgi:hypothetical protein